MIMSDKNVLAILGSPHTNGMTAAMLNLAICKAEQAFFKTAGMKSTGKVVCASAKIGKNCLSGQ